MRQSLIFRNLLFVIFYICFSIPIVFFMVGMPMILQMKGYGASTIGMFQAIGLPMVLKLFFSPPVDKFRFKKNHYKKWIFPVGILYFILLIFTSFLSVSQNISYLFLAIFLTTFVAVFIDIPLNALSIKIFSEKERIIASGYKMSAYFISLVLGGGVFLIAYNHLGWKYTILLMAILVLLASLLLFFIKENNSSHVEKIVTFKDIFSYFKLIDKKWLFVLSTYFIFASAVWTFIKPFLITKGINPDDIAFYVGIYGGIVGAISGLFMIFFHKFSKKTLLVWFGGLNFLAILSLLLVQNSINTFSILFFITLLSIGISFSSSLIYCMIMDYARDETKAIDYAIQSSIFSFTRIISAILAGLIVSSFGFLNMFMFELVGLGFVVLLIWKFYKE